MDKLPGAMRDAVRLPDAKLQAIADAAPDEEPLLETLRIAADAASTWAWFVTRKERGFP